MGSLRYISPCFIALFLLSLVSCGKNELNVVASLKDGGNRDVMLVYTAWSNKQDELRKEKVPLRNGAFTRTLFTKHATLVWIIAHDGKLLHAVYAEKGDEISISGNYSKPLEWKITGNEVSERYSDWLIANAKIAASGNPTIVNKAVEKYVKAHPDDVASALLLLTVYYRSADRVQYDKLWASLDIDDDEKERLMHIALAEMETVGADVSKTVVSPLTLRCRADSLVVVNPSRARATMLYFWRRTDGPHKGILKELSSQPADIQIADIYLDPDTVQWRYLTERDTFDRRLPLWAFGGEMNLSLSKLAVPSDPYIIVTDRKGKQLYRGESVADAVKAAAKAK